MEYLILLEILWNFKSGFETGAAVFLLVGNPVIMSKSRVISAFGNYSLILDDARLIKDNILFGNSSNYILTGLDYLIYAYAISLVINNFIPTSVVIKQKPLNSTHNVFNKRRNSSTSSNKNYWGTK